MAWLYWRLSGVVAPHGRHPPATRGGLQVPRRVRRGERRPDRLAVHLDGTAPEALNRRLVDGGVRVRELVVERPTLEDVFLRLTGGLGGRPAPDPPDPGGDRRVPG